MPGIFAKAIAAITNTKGSSLVDTVMDHVEKYLPPEADKQQMRLDLLKAEADRDQKIAEVAEKELETYMSDMKDSRNREIQIATSDKAPLINKIITPILALLIIGCTFALLGACMFYSFPPAQKDVVLYVLGALTAMSAGVIAYYFGSSKGSADKQRTLDKMMEPPKA
jgi:hypothetical protein